MSSDNPPPLFSTVPAPLYIGLMLSQTPPTWDDPGVEVATGGYQRMLVNFVRPSDDDDSLASTATFEWPRATALWGDVAYLTAWSTAGDYYGYGNVTAPDDDTKAVVLRIDRGDVARAKAGDIVIRPGFRQPRPWGKRGFGLWGWGLFPQMYALTGSILGAFEPAQSPCACCPSAWQMEALP